MPFYVEKPADKYGNVAYGYRVFEGHIETSAYQPKMVFDSPSEWAWVYMRSHGGFMETPGPARPLTFDEWCLLVGFVPPK